jgi:hypothetical protein
MEVVSIWSDVWHEAFSPFYQGWSNYTLLPRPLTCRLGISRGAIWTKHNSTTQVITHHELILPSPTIFQRPATRVTILYMRAAWGTEYGIYCKATAQS